MCKVFRKSDVDTLNTSHSIVIKMIFRMSQSFSQLNRFALSVLHVKIN